jgi:hypothetical protein
LESRKLLSGVDAVGTPDLEFRPPHVTLTPEVMAVHFGTGGGVSLPDCGHTGGSNVKKAPPANWVADAKVDFHPPVTITPTGPSLHPPNPCISRGPASQILIGLLHPKKAVDSGPYQTSVWGGIESIGTIKKG